MVNSESPVHSSCYIQFPQGTWTEVSLSLFCCILLRGSALGALSRHLTSFSRELAKLPLVCTCHNQTLFSSSVLIRVRHLTCVRSYTDFCSQDTRMRCSSRRPPVKQKRKTPVCTKKDSVYTQGFVWFVRCPTALSSLTRSCYAH